MGGGQWAVGSAKPQAVSIHQSSFIIHHSSFIIGPKGDSPIFADHADHRLAMVPARCPLAAKLGTTVHSLSKIAAYYAGHPAIAASMWSGLPWRWWPCWASWRRCPSTFPRPRRKSSPAPSPSTAAGCWRYSALTLDIEMVVGAAVLAAVFLPFGLTVGPVVGFGLYPA